MRLDSKIAGSFAAAGPGSVVRRAAALVVGLFLAGGLLFACTTEPLPGRCQKASECPTGETCELAPGSPDYKRCVSVDRDGGDGGVGDGGGSGGTGGGSGGGDAAGGSGTNDGGTEAAPPDPAVCPPGKCSAPEAPYCLPTGECAECVDNSNCPANKALCVMNRCVDCNMAGAGACQAPTPVCVPETGLCVACTDAARDCREPGKGFCVNNACVGCQDAPMGTCQAPTPACNPMSGLCVECVAHAGCGPDSVKPVCATNTCQSCAAEPAACATINMAKPVCNMASGACVECTASSDCSRDPKKPICDTTTNTCIACTEDTQCAAKGGGPGVCLAHIDGHCAADAETIYVENKTGCGSAGSAAAPACSTDEAAGLVRATRNVVVVRGAVAGATWTVPSGVGRVTVVGQQNAVIIGGPTTGILLRQRGDFLIRDLTVDRYQGPGIVAESGTTLRLLRVKVQRNEGGGIHIRGARFDIRDSLVWANGPGATGVLGGIIVEPPSGEPKSLERVTLLNNKPIGLTCDGAIQANGVLAVPDAAMTVAIAATCGVQSCTAGMGGCGSTLNP